MIWGRKAKSGLRTCRDCATMALPHGKACWSSSRRSYSEWVVGVIRGPPIVGPQEGPMRPLGNETGRLGRKRVELASWTTCSGAMITQMGGRGHFGPSSSDRESSHRQQPARDQKARGRAPSAAMRALRFSARRILGPPTCSARSGSCTSQKRRSRRQSSRSHMVQARWRRRGFLSCSSRRMVLSRCRRRWASSSPPFRWTNVSWAELEAAFVRIRETLGGVSKNAVECTAIQDMKGELLQHRRKDAMDKHNGALAEAQSTGWHEEEITHSRAAAPSQR